MATRLISAPKPPPPHGSAQLTSTPPNHNSLSTFINKTLVTGGRSMCTVRSLDNLMGARIALGHDRGTVRFCGVVPPSKGEWLGIEWDDAARGKHSGQSVDGTHYFHVTIPGSASFIRPTASKVSYGCSFLQALCNKYLPETCHSVQPTVGKPKYSRKNLAEIEIEAPKLDSVAQRTARLDRIKEVGLGGWRPSTGQDPHPNHQQHDASLQPSGLCTDVARAFDTDANEKPGDILKTCPNIRWLDLSRSLLPDWEQVAQIIAELAQLQVLVLHYNRFQPVPSVLPLHWIDSFAHLKDLRLDQTMMNWDELVRLSPALSRLESLQLGSNQITAMKDDGNQANQSVLFPRLKTLDLQDNKLSSWPQLVSALSKLPSLETLLLSNNAFQSIPNSKADGKTSTSRFPALKHLGLTGNPISSWQDFENLDSWIVPHTTDQVTSPCQGLQNLDILPFSQDDNQDMQPHGQPALDSAAKPCLVSLYEPHDFRAIMISRLAHLVILDRTPISAKERRDAELFVYSRIRQGSRAIIHGNYSSIAALADQGQDGDDSLVLSEDEQRRIFPRLDQLRLQFEGACSGTTNQPSVSDLEEEQQRQKAKGTLRAKLIDVGIFQSTIDPLTTPPYLLSEADYQTAKVSLQFLSSTPIRLARVKISKALAIKPTQIKHMWAMLQERGTESESGKIVFQMDDLSKDFSWYEVQSGDDIVVVVR